MYVLFGQAWEAHRVFCKMVDPDVFAWSMIISAHAKLGQGFEAIQIYYQMLDSKLEPDGQIFVMILKACTVLKSMAHGRKIHSHVIASAYEQEDAYVGSTLIDMYAKCGSLQGACILFERLPKQNIFTWSALIGGCTQNGYAEKALELFQQMHEEGFEPNDVLLACILKACRSSDQGKIMHAFIIEKGFDCDCVIGNTLVDMYAKCDNLQDAHSILDRLPGSNVITWSTLISGYLRHGHCAMALKTFSKMQERGVQPDQWTFACLLKACSKTLALQEGRQVHARIVERGWESDLFISNNLIEMYATCEEFKDAWEVFDRVASQDVVTWNVFMKECIEHGHAEEVFSLFEKMQNALVQPDRSSFLCLLKACHGNLEKGRIMHSFIIKNGLEMEVCVASSLIDMYIKCASLQHAQLMFDKLPEQDTIMWSILILGYAQLGYSQRAFQLFQKMQEAGIEPNQGTYVGLLKTCVEPWDLDQGRLIHCVLLEKALDFDVTIGNTLIDMYAKYACIQEAFAVSDALSSRDVFTWTALIAGCADCEHGSEALRLFMQMQHKGIDPNQVTFVCILKACSSIAAIKEGKVIHSHVLENGLDTDLYVANVLVDMYSNCGSLEDACVVFNNLQEKDTATWNSLIGGHARYGNGRKAMHLFHEMEQEGVEPDHSTIIFILKACSSIMALQQGLQIHARIIEKELEVDEYVTSALIDMYTTCGGLFDAMIVFEKLPKRQDIVTWSSMIKGCAQHCDYALALQYFLDMQKDGLKPDDVTFICLLSACSHVGLVEEGYKHLRSMMEDHGIVPVIDHLNSLADLLGRSNFLDEAEDLLESVPFRANCVGWTSLLDCCKIHVCVDVGKRCFDYLRMMDPRAAATYVLMSSIYCCAGMLDAAENVEKARKQAGAWKKLAKAYIEIDDQVHAFTVGDMSHNQIDDINVKLRLLNRQAKVLGYSPCLDFSFAR